MSFFSSSFSALPWSLPMEPEENPDMFTRMKKSQVLMLRKALDHYIKFQLGANSREASDYEDILKMLEDKLLLLDW